MNDMNMTDEQEFCEVSESATCQVTAFVRTEDGFVLAEKTFSGFSARSRAILWAGSQFNLNPSACYTSLNTTITDVENLDSQQVQEVCQASIRASS